MSWHTTNAVPLYVESQLLEGNAPLKQMHLHTHTCTSTHTHAPPPTHMHSHTCTRTHMQHSGSDTIALVPSRGAIDDDPAHSAYTIAPEW